MESRGKLTGISWNFLRLLIPVITLAAALVLAIYTYVNFASAEKALVQKMQTIADVHSQAVGYPLWTVDPDSVERSIQTIALYPEISCVEVIEDSIASVYLWPEHCKSQYNDEKLLSKELIFEQQPVGQLNLYYSVQPLTTELRADLLTSALFFFLLVSLGGLVAYAALQYIVKRPIGKLMDSIETFEKVGIRAPVKWSSTDELGRVIHAYNTMTQQVEDNTNELIKAREEAESATHTKGRFLANMSHELRTPLNAVIGISEMLREEVEDDGLDTEPYDRIAGSGRHLLNLIDEILDFSKLEANKIRLVVEEISIPELLEDICSTALPLADNRENILIKEYAGEPATLLTDAFRLRQIMINLLSNACKFTKKGTVTLTVRPVSSEDKSGVLFSVSDTGIGIPEDRIDQLFDEFSQADSSTTREYGGTGLGLAISHRLCILLGGEMKVSSTTGKGSEFSFILSDEFWLDQ